MRKTIFRSNSDLEDIHRRSNHKMSFTVVTEECHKQLTYHLQIHNEGIVTSNIIFNRMEFRRSNTPKMRMMFFDSTKGRDRQFFWGITRWPGLLACADIDLSANTIAWRFWWDDGVNCTFHTGNHTPILNDVSLYSLVRKFGSLSHPISRTILA